MRKATYEELAETIESMDSEVDFLYQEIAWMRERLLMAEKTIYILVEQRNERNNQDFT